MPRWLRDADFFRKREEERAENRRTQPTRPALICGRCQGELPSQWTLDTPLADKYFLVEESGVFVRHHQGCGGRVDWVEVNIGRRVKAPKPPESPPLDADAFIRDA